MPDITSYIAPTPLLTGVIKPNNNISVTTFGEGGNRLSELVDVDLSAVEDGAVLVYDGVTSKFVATVSVENPHTYINGGTF